MAWSRLAMKMVPAPTALGWAEVSSTVMSDA